MRIIAEIGSTHDGSFIECLKAIDNAARCGINDVKFQMLEMRHLKVGNIPLNRRWLYEIVRHGIDSNINVFASCWTKRAMDICKDAGCTSVKIAYSANTDVQLISYAVSNFKEVIISQDIMRPQSSWIKLIPGFKIIYCIPEYPVKYLVDFDGLFPDKFSGFSDHTMGINQTIRAVQSGAEIIEKHVLQSPYSQCPDARFAVGWDKIKTLREMFK